MGQTDGVRFDDIILPDTSAARAAREVSIKYCSPALFNHSFRSYLWAASYGMARGIEFDAELLYVSAMLHDIGLVKEFDSHTVAFEEAGGHVAWVFGAGAGWTVERRDRAAEVIIRHMWEHVDVAADPEGHLLELSTALDITGRNPDDWPADLRAEILAQVPRLDLNTEFFRCFEDQARRKPTSSAAAAVARITAARTATKPRDQQTPHQP